ADCRGSWSSCHRRRPSPLLSKCLAHSPPLISSTPTFIHPYITVVVRAIDLPSQHLYRRLICLIRHLFFMDARISAFVGPLAASASAPLTKMLISLHISKRNIWLVACFYSYRLHKIEPLQQIGS